MSKCSQCGKETENLEDWGDCTLCKKCVKRFRKEWPEKPPENTSNLEIGKPRTRGGASYIPSTGRTRFKGAFERDIHRVVNHEFLHFILHQLVGIRCCYRFDNVDKIVDPYHTSVQSTNEAEVN